ncbi:type I deoxyribonuclease HsdR [Bacteroidia bacterium]|nr:type I deoxyribonuclease HsdR [Bacteroidia bacterium]
MNINMKNVGKLFLSLVLVSALSVVVSVGTFSYLNKNNGNWTSNNEFNQTSGYRLATYSEAAENTDFTFAAEQSVNAVVHIKSVITPSQRGGRGEYIDPWEYFFGGRNPFFQERKQPKVGFGSGVIISNDGYIITNNHVIEGADSIEVTTNDDQTFKAKLIGGDEATDIALLKIDGKDLHLLPFGDSDILKVGEWVLAVGNPLNLTSTVTAGIVSATGRGQLFSKYDGMGSSQNKVQSYIQTDAAVNPGNSGGALVNTRGELIGINTALVSETGNYIGYSFAVPVNLVKKVVSDIKQYGVVQRAIIGVQVTELSELKQRSPEIYEKLKVHDGVYVAAFPANSSAQKAGIKEGDVITAINGTKIKNYPDLKAQLSRYSPGNKIEVTVQRDNDSKNITVELKNDKGTTEVIKHQSSTDLLGASFQELSEETKSKLELDYGIEITNLTNGKLKAAGLREGFIILTANDHRISSPETLAKIVDSILKQAPDDRGLFIKGFYQGSRKTEFYAVDLSE